MENHLAIPESDERDSGRDSEQNPDLEADESADLQNAHGNSQGSAQLSDQVASRHDGQDAHEDSDRDVHEDSDQDAEEDMDGDRDKEADVDHSPVPDISLTNDVTDVAVEQLEVTKWKGGKCEHFHCPDARAWLVAARGTQLGFDVHTDEQYREVIRSAHPDACRKNLLFLSNRRVRDHVWGQELLELTIPITTCGGTFRPEKLYRAIHAQMPHGGIRA